MAVPVEQPPEPGPGPLSEIREYGDKDLIILFTRDDYTYRRFRQWKECRKEVKYTSGPLGSVTAADLYFPRALAPLLRRLIGIPNPPPGKTGGTPAPPQGGLPGFA
jgi:hypothetical protein